MPAREVRLLECCRTFDTLEGHARRICDELNLQQEKSEAIQTELTSFAGRDLLVSKRRLFETFKSQPSSPIASPAISSICLFTKDRPESLQRALASYMENCKQNGRDVDFLVLDDSPQPAVRDANLKILQQQKNLFGVGASYAGIEERGRFIDELIQPGDIPAEVVNFALANPEQWPNSCGANRNAHLLQTVGEHGFTADDDTLCQLVAAPEQDVALQFASHTDPAEFWFFSDREQFVRSVQFTRADLLGLHEQFLGKTIGSLTAGIAGADTINFERMSARPLDALQARGGKIIAVLPGHAGDPGWGAPFGYAAAPVGCLLLDDRSHQRLVQSEAGYKLACVSRDLLRVVNCPTISDTAAFASTFVGLDNRATLPPFMPIGRSQDVIFGETLSRCVRDGYCCHLPWALRHDPVEKRRFWPAEILRTASGLGLANVLIECIRSHEPLSHAVDEIQRLRGAGDHLVNLASLPVEDFMEFLRLRVCHTMSGFINWMETCLQHHSAMPRYWANDLEQYMELLSQSMVKDEYFVPLDLIAARPIDEAKAFTQHLVGRFGSLLTWWPAILERSRELKLQGRRLARPV